MTIRRFTLLTAALAASAVSLLGAAGTASAAVAVAVNTFPVSETGQGASLTQAENNAKSQIFADYSGCRLPFLIDDGQNSNGSWWATEGDNCTGFI